MMCMIVKVFVFFFFPLFIFQGLLALFGGSFYSSALVLPGGYQGEFEASCCDIASHILYSLQCRSTLRSRSFFGGSRIGWEDGST